MDARRKQGDASLYESKRVERELEIARARQAPFERFLTALSIPEVGSATARLLAGHFDSLDALRGADEEGLQHVEGIGPATVKKHGTVILELLHGQAAFIIERQSG